MEIPVLTSAFLQPTTGILRLTLNGPQVENACLGGLQKTREQSD